ncbi:FAD-dependent oxidoreductase [Paenibacillus arenilitoris]|uniref:FAD-dependent monooxygenase n=1 Tax=Paenibacillus arenilitoris TaxID=2772299 RepID=A0A927H365_9BACL|nr:FAD-dependent monooxygenase [Paenibacillus arenilitoris]MBD2866986.1 FAD-dependent monooxygenase [Paenibacillus arenilitoris]
MNTERAVIVGGGIAGLLAAKVLSGFFGEVVIVDRDAFPQEPDNRAGTPQAFQPHRFTPRSRLILNRLFPGFIDALIKHGAHPARGQTTHLISPYGRMIAVEQNHDASFSRALFEWVIRSYIRKIENVRLVGMNEAIRLQTSEDRSRVTGIVIRERTSGERQPFTMTADLIIDASGRFSKTVQWLSELGYEVPQPERLKLSLGYSTRRYRIPAGRKQQLDAIRMEGNPLTSTHAGAFSIIEKDTAEMVLWNLNGRYPSTDPALFEQEVRQLENPLLNEAIKGLEPIGQPRGFRVPELFRYRFEQMRQWPSGLLVMGDAFCQLDPVYGQGMTLAAIEAEILEACLHRQLNHPKPGFELDVLQRMQDSIEAAWWLNVVSDLRWEGVEHVGTRPIQGLAFAQHYFEHVLKWSTEHANYDVYGLYWLVNSLFLSPWELFNADRITSLLAAGGSGEAKRWLDRWIEESDRPLDERLSLTIPSFKRASFESIDQLMSSS